MSTNSISPNDDIIDSRDVIARIEDLEAREDFSDDDLFPPEPLDDFERHELAALRVLAEQGENNASDWQYGAALIHDDYFVDYARQTAEDIGAVSSEAGWPTQFIDWDAAADALRMDYSGVEYDGATFWVR